MLHLLHDTSILPLLRAPPASSTTVRPTASHVGIHSSTTIWPIASHVGILARMNWRRRESPIEDERRVFKKMLTRTLHSCLPPFSTNRSRQRVDYHVHQLLSAPPLNAPAPLSLLPRVGVGARLQAVDKRATDGSWLSVLQFVLFYDLPLRTFASFGG